MASPKGRRDHLSSFPRPALTGNDKKTAPFSFGTGQKRILYNLSGTPGYSLASIRLFSTNGGLVDIISVEEQGTGESYLYNVPAGTYYLDIGVANCTVEVTIQEMK